MTWLGRDWCWKCYRETDEGELHEDAGHEVILDWQDKEEEA